MTKIHVRWTCVVGHYGDTGKHIKGSKQSINTIYCTPTTAMEVLLMVLYMHGGQYQILIQTHKIAPPKSVMQNAVYYMCTHYAVMWGPSNEWHP